LWQAFFDNQASRYEENPFTSHTVAEIDFFLSLFAITPGSRILDMGCGTGRHSIELAARGYHPTGVDISPGMLSIARKNAAAKGLEIEWIQADARSWQSDRLYDAAICLCEGGVGLLDPGENAERHDHAIFSNIAAALSPGAPFLLTAMNAYAIIRQMSDDQIVGGRFNPANMYATYQDEWELPEGIKAMNIFERLFIPPELVKLLNAAGFVVDNVFGGTAGHWARRFLSLDEVEAMYVCRRQ
jgi:cyclopropane fatty-acyl-phospholipid synthase-like methyltransferase